MLSRLTLAATLAAALAACGGGGGGYGGGGGNPPPTNPSPSGGGNIPMSATVAGSSAWVDPHNQHTLYFLSSDTATGAACTGGCTAIWPVDTPGAGAAGQGAMTIISRSDGSKQWAFNGHPLYFYSGDSGSLQSNGDGISQPPGVWHVSRPSSSSVGGSTPPPGCTGPYC